MKRIFAAILLLATAVSASAQDKSSVKVGAPEGDQVIPREIYGQFAEHLGSGIYGGIWVGPESPIPNINGYRTDVLEALKAIKVPLVRWPGGCFADDYHWRNGIGPREKRPSITNNNWGGTVEDNSFGTHEFLDFCELLGCEPYISGNVGSGSVEELADWIEYMTAASDTPMSRLRRQNGRDKPWKVKYIGIGNEAWGCGGNMRPEYYSDLLRRYATYCHDFDGNKLFIIASGASDYDYNWTDVILKNRKGKMDGISLHYYSVDNWGNKGSATDFTKDDWYWVLGKSTEVEEVIKNHIALMDKYDPRKRIALCLDEWGTWWNVEPGTNPGHLFQQSTMRDAMVASTTLDICHKYSDRLKMTNIAQMVNVLQAMVLTQGEKMLLTPTYYVYKMYTVHQGATFLPVEVSTATKEVRGGRGKATRTIPLLSATASRDGAGRVHVSLSNLDADNVHEVTVDLEAVSKSSKAVGEILASKNITDHNEFGKAQVVKTVPFKDFRIKGGQLTVKMPAASIVTIELQ